MWCVLGVLVVVAGALPAQGRGKQAPAPQPPPVPASSPYLDATGVEGFAGGRRPEEVEQVLGRKVLWLETDHFRIGSTLGAYALTGGDPTRGTFDAELARLRRSLPRVPAKATSLDPWLRLHLYGQRLEELHADLERQLGASDGDWPDGKQEVLLLEDGRSLHAFGMAFLGFRPTQSQRHFFFRTRTLLFVTAVDLFGPALRNDRALHGHVAYHATANLLDGYLGFRFDIPVWLKVGLCQHHARRVDPRSASYEQLLPTPADAQLVHDWRRHLHQALAEGTLTPAAELMQWFDVAPMRIGDTIACWSRVDFLLERHGMRFADLVRAVKQPGPATRLPPTREEVLARQSQALKDTFGTDEAGLDRAWREYVLPRPVIQARRKR
ncbi:MAG: hypothetical protein IT458_08225 [Planctomycetes bacterium]|nr:hypothetical protein [Planctomycetota bacterium]